MQNNYKMFNKLNKITTMDQCSQVLTTNWIELYRKQLPFPTRLRSDKHLISNFKKLSIAEIKVYEAK